MTGGKSHAQVVEFFRYVLISALGLAIDLAVSGFLNFAGLYISLSSATGYFCGLVAIYPAMKKFVFLAHVTARHTLHLYLGSGIVGTVTTFLLSGFLGDILHLPFLVAKGVAVCGSFFSVYLLRKFVVFIQMPRPTITNSRTGLF